MVESHLFRRCAYCLGTLLVLGCAADAVAVERVLATIDGQRRELLGRLIAEDPLGNMLLETNDGAIWQIEGDDILGRSSDDKPLVPLGKEQLAKLLLDELGPEFQVHRSKNYVIVFNTTRTYAKWCSSLLERLQRAFISFWKKQGCNIHPPKAPLMVLIFSDKSSYLRHARNELGASAKNVIGYYSFQSNRIVMYDLTGMQELRRKNSRRGTLHDITALLSQPQAEPLVATIVHEATHQVSFNCGLQTRYKPPPIWLSEGLAVYFETPDLSSKNSWRGIGKVNYARWNRFRQTVQNNRQPSLEDLLSKDSLFHNPRTAVDTYAAAWAWTYFLVKWHPKEYVSYLEMFNDKRLDQPDDAATRLADFRQYFGDDLKALQEEFYRRMSRLK